MKPVEEPDFWSRDEVQPQTAGPTTWDSDPSAISWPCSAPGDDRFVRRREARRMATLTLAVIAPAELAVALFVWWRDPTALRSASFDLIIGGMLIVAIVLPAALVWGATMAVAYDGQWVLWSEGLTWIPGETSWAIYSEAVSVETLNGRPPTTPPTAYTTRWSNMRGVKTYPANKVVEINGPFGIAQPVFCDEKTWDEVLAAMKAHGVLA